MIAHGLDVETGSPKYARIEYERRWLVDPAKRPALDGRYTTLIEDRYIDSARLRLRRMTRADFGEIKWKLTKKYDCADPAARPIVTFYLSEREYDLLLALPAHVLVKRRHHLQLAGRWWSLDVFEGKLAGLELLECEVEDRLTLDALHPPDWVLREVTDLAQWQCGALARAGAVPEDRWPVS